MDQWNDRKWTVSWAKLNLRSISSFLGSSSSVLDEDGSHKSVIWVCSSVSNEFSSKMKKKNTGTQPYCKTIKS